tara:strand:+ start:739 stop:861 length:123 start_codon:yes stop_codon:yes gene_type:complete
MNKPYMSRKATNCDFEELNKLKNKVLKTFKELKKEKDSSN